MVSDLCGRRARSVGSDPPFELTIPADYNLEIVVVWVQDGSAWTMVADVVSGKITSRRLDDLELEPQEE